MMLVTPKWFVIEFAFDKIVATKSSSIIFPIIFKGKIWKIELPTVVLNETASSYSNQTGNSD